MLSEYNKSNESLSKRKDKGKISNTWKLNNKLVNNLWVEKEVSKERKNKIELNKN